MQFARVQQDFSAQPEIIDVAARTLETLRKAFPDPRELHGKRIAVTAGSRGIAKIYDITKTAIEWLLHSGANPFVIPAMGSHGGATAAGQRKVLASYGITEESLGVPIIDSMETICIGHRDDIPLIWSCAALEADGVLLINRIKPHTGFVDAIESGLCKIATIGLGKQSGAERYHRIADTVGMGKVVQTVAAGMIEKGKILGGLGIVENASHRPAYIQAMTAAELLQKERELLARAKMMMPSFPFAEIDVLYVQEMGKNISGNGVDPNVIARSPTGFRQRPLPREGQSIIGTVCVSMLTPQSGGNAVGIGLVDGISTRLQGQIDPAITKTNALTAYAPEVGEFTGQVCCDDRELLSWAVERSGRQPARVVLIENSLNLEVFYISEALLPMLEGRSDFSVLDPPHQVPFDAEGHLCLNFQH